MKLSEHERAIEKKALEFARSNKKRIAKAFTDKAIYPSEENPVSVFMAGSPGAGKTEASIALVENAPKGVIRIDPDSLRTHFEDYDGSNSYLFQRGVSVLVEKIHDLVLSQKQSFILDGTLSNYDVAVKNIDRSLSKQRSVLILYVYQEPAQAWNFVVAREQIEGRRILAEHFIEQYYQARDVVNQLKKTYGEYITADLLIKNIDGSNRTRIANIENIGNHNPEKYTHSEIENIIKLL
jgi:UDP-N-acetylglucosamine kinase